MKSQDLQFVKMQGCGNSFVVVADLHPPFRDWDKLAPALSDPHFGVGGDGVMLILPSKSHDFLIKMYNPDGSLGGMCGNGVRCVVRYLVLHKLVAADAKQISFEFGGRSISAKFAQEGRLVHVDMGVPIFTPRLIPISSERQLIAAPFRVDGIDYSITTVSMGNPHCVIFVSDLGQIDLAQIGPKIERAELFPERTNVEFVQKISENRLRVLGWERGAGATLACGSGACAVVVAAVLNQLADRDCAVELPGGEVRVKWDQASERVTLSGPAKEVFFGSIPSELLP